MQPTGPDSDSRAAPRTTDRPAAPGEAVGSAFASEPGGPEEAGSRWGVLRHAHFRNVWAAALVSSIGSWMELLAIQLVAAHLTGSLKVLGYLGAAQMLPILLFGALGGLLADRVNRKRLLVVTQCMLMLLAATLATASALDRLTVPVLFAVALAHGTVSAFNMPAWQVLTPRLVPRAELTRAITLNSVQFNLARCIGPALAGVIMGLYGATELFVINTLTYVAVLFAVALTPAAPAPPRNRLRAGPGLRQALVFILTQRGPLFVFLAMILMSLLAAPLIRMIALFSIDVYGLPAEAADKATGLLLSVLGIGAVIGGLGLRWVPYWYPRHHLIPVSLVGAGLTITLFAFAGSLAAGIPLMLLVGVFWLLGFNQPSAAMQHLVPDEMRGRVMGLFFVASFGVAALGNAASGSLGEALKGYVDAQLATQLSVGLLSLLLMAAGIAMLVRRVPEMDGVDPAETGGGSLCNVYEGLTARSHRPAPPAPDGA